MALAGGFDALILDADAPEGQDAGFGVARRLHEKGDATPILFLTVRADPDSRLTGLDLGGDEDVSRPFDFRELRSRFSKPRHHRPVANGTRNHDAFPNT